MLPLDIFVTLIMQQPDRTFHVSRDYTRTEPACRNKLANLIAESGWHGIQNRIAWAIVQRESNGKPHAVSSGAYGLFQLQASVHSGNSWWNWSDILTSRGNAKQARALWRGSGWQPWGIMQVGESWAVNAADYSSWDQSTIDAWIRQPFEKYWNAYPCKVAP